MLAVADASVLINLIHSGSFAGMVSAAGMSLCATGQVLRELQAGDAEFDSGRLRSALAGVERVELSSKAHGEYRQLTQGQLEHSLDDGEAETIAYAHDLSLPALMDERKGIGFCEQKGIDFFTSVDVFRRALKGGLGRAAVAEAVYRALKDGNMGVRPEDLCWVASLIGKQRAKSCPSLPERFRRGL